MLKTAIMTSLMVLTTICGFAQNAADNETTNTLNFNPNIQDLSLQVAFSDLETSLSTFFRQEGLGENSRLSCLIGNAQTGELYVNINGNVGMRAGSLTKLVSTAAAIDILNYDYRAVTEIFAEGQISEEGILEGNLVIKGGGDPTLGTVLYSEDEQYSGLLESWSEKLKNEYSIDQINGQIIGDSTRYIDDRLGIGWDYSDRANGQLAEVNALTYYLGVVEVEFDADRKPGKRVYYDEFPETDYITIENEVLVAEPEAIPQGVGFIRVEESRVHTAFGTLPEGVTEVYGTAIHDSAMYTATLFENALRKKGISTGLPPTVRYATVESYNALSEVETQPLLSHFSPQIIEWARFGFYQNNNLVFESMGRELSLKMNYPPNFQGVGAALIDWADQNGYQRNQFVVVDASGQSSYNQIPALSFYDLLLEWQGLSKKQQAFQSTLPTAGQGYLVNLPERLDGRYSGMLSLRINSVGAAGYIENDDDRYIVVVMIDKSVSPKITLDRILQQIDSIIRLL